MCSQLRLCCAAAEAGREASRDPGERREIQSEQGESLVLPRHCQHVLASLCLEHGLLSALQQGRQWDFSWIREADMARELLAALWHQHLPNLLLMSISLEADAATHTQARRSTFQSVI